VLLELAEEHPLVRHVQHTGDGSARRVSDVVSRQEFQASELYRRLYQPMRVEFQMSVTLTLPRPAVVAVTVSRHSQDFTDRERLLLDLLRPHLTHGWQQARQMSHLAALSADAVPAGAAGARRPPDAGGTLALALSEPRTELTPGALAELHRFFGPPATPQSALPERVERWLAQPPTAQRPHPRALLAQIGHRNALLRWLPPGPGHPAILCINVDIGITAATRPSLSVFGLSQREVQVVNLVVTGATNQEIAKTLRVAPGTVKKHLDHIYAKLGVRGRVQAATLALELETLERTT